MDKRLKHSRSWCTISEWLIEIFVNFLCAWFLYEMVCIIWTPVGYLIFRYWLTFPQRFEKSCGCMLQTSPKDPNVCYHITHRENYYKNPSTGATKLCAKDFYSAALIASSSRRLAARMQKLTRPQECHIPIARIRNLPQVHGGRAFRVCHVMSAEDV